VKKKKKIVIHKKLNDKNPQYFLILDTQIFERDKKSENNSNFTIQFLIFFLISFEDVHGTSIFSQLFFCVPFTTKAFLSLSLFWDVHECGQGSTWKPWGPLFLLHPQDLPPFLFLLLLPLLPPQ
jgi:hypothetical protein